MHTPRNQHHSDTDNGSVDWGQYAMAVHRWELITGRNAPHPTQLGQHGRPVLAPPFVEWLMRLPQGWVTAEYGKLPRTVQLRVLGASVMPQQAAHALHLLLNDLAQHSHVVDHHHKTPQKGLFNPYSKCPNARRTAHDASAGGSTTDAM